MALALSSGMIAAGGTPRTLVFRRRHRLGHAREFQAVYAARAVAKQGPLTVFGLPSELGEARLGLSVGRRAGGAVVRTAAKRRVREAFRTVRAEFERPTGALDIVVVVGPHEPLTSDAYLQLLRAAAKRLWKVWDRRSAGAESGPGAGS